MAERALFRGLVAFIDITADAANKFLHVFVLLLYDDGSHRPHLALGDGG